MHGWGTGSIRVHAADGHLTEIRTTAPPDDAEFVLCPGRLDRLARELLDVASTAPDPLPLVEAARALLSMTDATSPPCVARARAVVDDCRPREVPVSVR